VTNRLRWERYTIRNRESGSVLSLVRDPGWVNQKAMDHDIVVIVWAFYGDMRGILLPGSPHWKHSELFFEKKALIPALQQVLSNLS
jgi:hypothetical protein